MSNVVLIVASVWKQEMGLRRWLDLICVCCLFILFPYGLELSLLCSHNVGHLLLSRGVPQVIQFALRDYIQYWYYTLSEDDSFLLEIRQTLQNALVQFSTR